MKGWIKWMRRLEKPVRWRNLWTMILSLSIPQCKVATQVQDANLRKIWWDQLPKVPSEDVYEGYAALRHDRGSTCSMFQNTLTGAALRWFLNLDDARARSWEDIYQEFHKHYKYNREVDITRRDLETTKQELKESFSTFITKWRAKAIQMMSRPSEEE